MAQRTGVFEIAGFWDDDKSRKGEHYCGFTVMGSLERLSILKNEFDVANIILAIGDNSVREQLADSLPDVHFPRIIDPTALVGKGVKIGVGTVVMPGAVLEPFAHIGCHCIVNNHAVVGHNVRIGDFCHVGGGAIVSGQCTVGCGTLIGINACIIQNLHIGQYCRIGAGAVVLKNFPDNTTALGNPARIITNCISKNHQSVSGVIQNQHHGN
jgi:acetyltransferase EpsM